MKRFLPVLLLAALCACQGPAPEQASAPQRVLSVVDFGAAPGVEATEAIQAALDSCAAAGGGRVVVPAGVYRVRTLRLRDSVDLHLEKDAVLAGLDDPEAYSPYVPASDLSRYDSGGGTANANCVSDRRWMRAMIVGDGVRNASITGEGTLDGRHVFDPLGEESMRGPHTVVVGEAVNFRLEGIRITCAANYAFLGYALENACFEGLRITEGWDGIHIRGGKNVRIAGCVLETGDDCIAGGYWEHMLIEDCVINSSCNGIRMIMPSDGVEVRDCAFYGPGNHPHRTSGEARRNNMLFGISLEPGAWGAAPGVTRHIYLHDLSFRDLTAPVATSVREGCTAEDLTLERLSATGLTGNPVPVVSWLDRGFDTLTVSQCSFAR